MNNPRTPRGLKLESLEDRKLMAGNVTAGLESRDLWIRGDNRDNHIEIRQLANLGQFRITGLAGTTVNGRSFVDITTPTTDVHIRMNGGNDRVDLGSPVGSRPARMEDLTVDMGTGSDTFVMANAVVTDPVDDSIIQMGGSENDSDVVNLIATQFNSNARISTGGGNDWVFLNQVNVRRQLNVQTGNGNDYVALTDAVFANSMIDGGAGNDELVRRRGNAVSARNFER